MTQQIAWQTPSMRVWCLRAFAPRHDWHDCNQPSEAFLRKLRVLGQSRGVQVVEWGNGTEPLLMDPKG